MQAFMPSSAESSHCRQNRMSGQGAEPNAPGTPHTHHPPPHCPRPYLSSLSRLLPCTPTHWRESTVRAGGAGWEGSHLRPEAQQGGEEAGEVVHGDVPEESRQLGCIAEQVPQDGHGQLHRGGRVLGLKATNPTLLSSPPQSPRGGGPGGRPARGFRGTPHCHPCPNTHWDTRNPKIACLQKGHMSRL